jgi:hypothetical protein
MNTIFWVLWVIGAFGIYYGIYLAFSQKEKREILKGWLLMIIGVIFNMAASIIDANWFALIVCIIALALDYDVYRTKKKQFELEELGARELFMKELNEFGLNRK